MTEAEIEVVDLLGEVATKFFSLSEEHPSDKNEFTLAIHAAQNIVYAREGLRSYRSLKNLPDDFHWRKS